MIKIKAARYGFPECSDGGGTPELEGNSGVNRGEAQLRANFEACKLQANSALQRCTVTPRPSNCALATLRGPVFEAGQPLQEIGAADDSDKIS